MKQLVLDIGLSSGPSLTNFFTGPNQQALEHLGNWVGDKAHRALRSPVPIYLWGNTGSGKSHLLKAAREALREQGSRTGWLDATLLEPPEFDDAWAAVVLDDVHAYGSVQQQAAFNWFVQAQTLQRPVLAAGALPPADLRLRDDLRSRLAWGHVFGLKVLSEPERRAVLRQEADARGIFIGDEVMDFILTRFSRDLGSLMPLLDQLVGFAFENQRAISVPLVRAMLHGE